MFQKLLKRMREKPLFGWAICYSLVSSFISVSIINLPVCAPVCKFAVICFLLLPQMVLPFLELALLSRERRVCKFFLLYLKILPFQLLIAAVLWVSHCTSSVAFIFFPLAMTMPFCLIGSWCKRMVRLGYL